MPTEFEGDIKKTSKKPTPQPDKPKQDPDREGAEDCSEERKRDESSPLKTVGGTPIIERPEG
jgi:hypothetical protein